MKKTIKVGSIYNHYKKHLVKVVGIAPHTETLEDLVIYEAQDDFQGYKKGQLWARPKKMFLEEVTIDGKKVPRFRLVSEPSKAQISHSP